MNTRQRVYIDSIAFRIDPTLRAKVEEIADLEEKSLGEIARELINKGIQAREPMARAGAGI